MYMTDRLLLLQISEYLYLTLKIEIINQLTQCYWIVL